MKTVTLPVKGLNFAGCAREIEKRLGKLEPITQVEASYVSQTVTITYDETTLDEAQLREMVKDCGFACGKPLTEGRGPTPTALATRPHARSAQHMDHGTMGLLLVLARTGCCWCFPRQLSGGEVGCFIRVRGVLCATTR